MFQILDKLLAYFVPVSGFFEVLLLEEFQVYKVVLLFSQLRQSLKTEND